jgi:hypothetical protein
VKILTVAFVFAAGFCLGAALPASRLITDANSAWTAVISLVMCAGFFVGGAVALIIFDHPSTKPLTTEATESSRGVAL